MVWWLGLSPLSLLQPGSIPGLETEIPHQAAAQGGQKTSKQAKVVNTQNIASLSDDTLLWSLLQNLLLLIC